MTSSRFHRLLQCLVSVGFLIATSLFLPEISMAQVSTAEVIGTVRDASGAFVPNASVTLTLTERNAVRTTQTNGSGEYTFGLLQNGTYKLSVDAPGFAQYQIQQFALDGGDRRRLDVALTLEGSHVAVNVTSAPSMLGTDTSNLSTQVSQRQVQDLPLNGRNFVQLAQLAAGANEGTSSAIANGNRPDDRRQTSAVVANAQSDTLNYQMVEGVDNVEYTVGTIGVRPSVDAIAEFRVITSVPPAEVGKTPGAIINLITRSGSSQFHGSIFEFVRNDLFDARNFFATKAAVPTKPKFRQNQFGGSISGPVFRDKTFFFADYEGFRRIDATNSLVNNLVPTAYEVAHPGDFSDRGGPVLSSSQINSIGAKYFALYPAPNNGATTYTSSYPQTQNSTTADARIDHHFNERNSIFGRWAYNNVDTLTPSALPNVGGVDPGGSVSFPGSASQQAYQWIADYIHVFNPSLLLELKAGYTHISNVSLPLNYGKNYGNAFGITNANLDIFTSALPTVSVTGYAPLGVSSSLPLFDRDNAFQYSAALTQVKGRHSLKYGAMLIRRQVYNEQPTSGSGAFTFTTNPSTSTISTLSPLINLLEGNVFQVSRVVQLYPRYLRNFEPSLFVQDDWRATDKLTLNLGLRYDIITPVKDKFGHISHFDPASGTFRVAGGGGGSDTADIQTDYRSIAPRVGMAFSATSKTVLRAGYAVVFFRDNTGPSVPFADPPYVGTYQPNPNTTTFSTPLPLPALASTTSPSGALRGMQLDYRNSYVHEINANVQQDLGFDSVLTLAYVAELGQRLRISPNVNLGPLGQTTAGAYTTLRPFYSKYPAVTDIYNIQSNGSSNFNSFQATLAKQTSHGLTLQANYTWAHALGDVQGFSAGGLYTSADPAHNSTVEYGNSELDVRNRFTMMLNYRLAFADHLNGFAGVVGKGWQFNAIDVWETGQPFTVVNSSPRTNTGVGSDRPNQVGNPNIANRTIATWFNTSAFAAQLLGTLGTTSRNSLYGPHYRHFDVSLFKDFQLPEKAVLQLRAEAFNLSNTPNFGQPGSTLGTSTFGVINSLRTNAQGRQLQFAARLSF
ncbi:TonB-dependent receptor domain-containing protein [Terriglobus sp. TAA 43]|uniref:TonB-dependent receptor domain-containing protein n=1 Tax=Terriglobus sp. TAA 43 TaxID=278961 RepID=UPI000AF7E8E5|nr:TonB-dependent receptor [Terriglobus sp. TAA 43]